MKDYGIDRLLGQKGIENDGEIMDLILSLKDYDLKVLDYVHSRVFWDWQRLGLIDMSNIQSGVKQRKGVSGVATKMNLLGYFWVNIVADLRRLGVKTHVIRNAKEILHQGFPADAFDSKESNEKRNHLRLLLASEDEEMIQSFLKQQAKEERVNQDTTLYVNDLFMLVFNLIHSKHDIRILIDFDGFVEFYDAYAESTASVMHEFDEPMITISLKHYLIPLLQEEKNHTFLSKHKLLSSKEKRIFEVLKQDDVSELHIKLKDGEPYMLTVDKKNMIDTHARLSEVLVKGGYEEIILKTQYGKVTFSKSSLKEKL